jgi:magnesium chelatase subunit I
MSRPGTLGELRESGWVSRPVKQEIRENAIAKIAAGEPVVDGVVGYEETVLPQLENALLAAHDVIFLGERGQAKTRIIRSLANLMDEWMPVIAGSEINDDPYHPVSQHSRLLVAERGDETPIEWVHRERRYSEKLATPDTSIADLIGEVDPIKVAEGRYLSDELTIHYGLVPRTNRGRIITPLKDRFGAQIRTHYPLDVDVEMDVIELEARPVEPAGLPVRVPEFMTEVVAEVSQQARRSPHINQRSGVSVRLSIANYETLVANATRRALRNQEGEVVPRVSDLEALVSSTAGKVEFETVDDGREEQILDRIVKAAVLETFRARCRPENLVELVHAFDEGMVVHTGADVPGAQYAKLLSQLPGLPDTLKDLEVEETPAAVASAVEFVLEGLHLSKRLNKDAVGTKAAYRGRS